MWRGALSQAGDVRWHSPLGLPFPPSVLQLVGPYANKLPADRQPQCHCPDQTVIALWLGHESVETTQVYIHADLRLKEKALARLSATNAKPGRYRPDDRLPAFLEAL